MTTHSSIITHEVLNTPSLDTSLGRHRVRGDFFATLVTFCAILLAITFGGILLLALTIASSFLAPPRLPTDDEIALKGRRLAENL
jgi:hypothetical protein